MNKRCPNSKCRSTHIVKIGKISTIKKGKRVRYRCQACGKTFY